MFQAFTSPSTALNAVGSALYGTLKTWCSSQFVVLNLGVLDVPFLTFCGRISNLGVPFWRN